MHIKFKIIYIHEKKKFKYMYTWNEVIFYLSQIIYSKMVIFIFYKYFRT